MNSAWAANQQLSIVITSPPSTATNCTIAYPSGQTSFVEPVAPGTVIANCSVSPSTWSGVITLSGADASVFALSGEDLIVGTSAITVARTYNITVTSTP